ncbi:MAG: Nramp family divalent metal transporter [Phycisphaerales bacterium]
MKWRKTGLRPEAGGCGDQSPPVSDVPPTACDVQTPPTSLLGTLARLGPGMIIAGSIVGSGELIATTKTGAEAGFWLLWLVLIGCVIKVSTQIEFARHAITWGQTPLKAINEVPGPRLRVNWLVGYWTLMTALIVFQQGGILGGVGQTLAIGCPLTACGAEYNHLQDELTQNRIQLKLLETKDSTAPRMAELRRDVATLSTRIAERPEPRDTYLWSAILATATSILLYLGRYRVIQFVSTALVATFTLVTILTVVALQMRPEWAVSARELGNGLSFHLPPSGAPGGNPVRTALGAFGIIGVGASELLIYPYWCLEKGYARYAGPRDGSTAWLDRARGWIRVLYVDAWSSMVVYTFATVAFYLLGAAVLGRIGINPEGRDMVRTLAAMYVPVFGSWAYPVFLCGAFAVLYSTLFVAAAGNSRMVADGMGQYGLTDGSEAARVKWTRRISAIWPFIALVLYLFVRAPATMIIACGICQSIMLPLLGGTALYFRYRRSDPNLRPGRLWDAMLWIAFVAFLVVGVWSVVAIFR